MPRFDATTAECLVFTYKQGLLSPLAHDLMIRVETFDLDATTAAVRARFDAGSLRVVCAMKDGVRAPGVLSRRNAREIERNIAGEVLGARTYPDIGFKSDAVIALGREWRVSGTLSLHGALRPLSFVVRPQSDRLVTEVRLHQPDFGIRPYRAAMGTLRVMPDVLVRVSAPRVEG